MIRFWSKVDKRGPDDCWEWQGALSVTGGYGQIRVAGKTVKAHRLAYELAHDEEIPENMCVCHTCDNRPCMNPLHLFLGSKGDNNRDRHAKGRSHTKLTDDQVQGIRLDTRAQHLIAKDHGIHQTMVSKIKRGDEWAS